MLRFLFFLIIFYVIFQGIKIFIRAFIKRKQTNSYRTNSNRNIEEAEFTEVESKIHSQDKESTDG